MSESKDDYEVGYGKPPVNTRFKPGQSGNSKGRPPKTKDLQKIVDRTLSQRINVKENGNTRMLTMREAIIKTIAIDAVKGDHKAQRMLLPFMSKETDLDRFEVDPEGEAMLEDLLKQHASPGSEEDDA